MEDLIRRTIGPENQLEVVGAVGPVDHAGRPAPARERAAQPVPQRARRHARRRPPDDRDGQQLDGRAHRQGARPAAGPVRVALRDRHRHRHAAGRGPARVRALLHRPSRSAWAPAWACRWSTASRASRAGRCASIRKPGWARRCASTCRATTRPRRSTRPPPSASEAPHAGAGTVLVVDDEPTVRALVSEVLVELGYRILEAEEGATGLALLQSNVPIDLLITDVGLPGGMNGRQLADAARRRAARPQGAVHHGLRRERGGRQRPPGPGHGGHDQALHARCARGAGAADGGRKVLTRARRAQGR